MLPPLAVLFAEAPPPPSFPKPPVESPPATPPLEAPLVPTVLLTAPPLLETASAFVVDWPPPEAAATLPPDPLLSSPPCRLRSASPPQADSEQHKTSQRMLLRDTSASPFVSTEFAWPSPIEVHNHPLLKAYTNMEVIPRGFLDVNAEKTWGTRAPIVSNQCILRLCDVPFRAGTREVHVYCVVTRVKV